jgi:hypothetical protein
MKLLLDAVSVACILLSFGCNGASYYDLTVKPDDSLRGALRRVDVVGVQEDELPTYKAKDVDKWFGANDQLRNDSREFIVAKEFSGSQQDALVIPTTHPVWKVWEARRATHVVIFAHFQWVGSDDSSQSDPRKKVLPLNNKAWEKPRPDEVTVVMGKSKMTAFPPPTASEKK